MLNVPHATRGQWKVVISTLVLVILYLALFGTKHRLDTSHSLLRPIKASVWTERPRKYPITTMQKLPTGHPLPLPKIQHTFGKEALVARQLRERKLQAVRDSSVRTWNGYKKHAWLKDELKPISGGSKDSDNWSATLVDSLDTLWIMGLRDEFEEAVSAVANINFTSSTSKTINVFEATTRYLGGLLSAYDLSGRPILLEKALDLGNMLYAAFDTPNKMPVLRWNWKSALDGEDQSALSLTASADIGSLSLEFTRLSQLSNDPKFFDAIQSISEAFAKTQAKTVMSGMWPAFVDGHNLNFLRGNDYTLNEVASSLYEYLPKMYILLGGHGSQYREMYYKFLDAAKRFLFFRPMNPQNKDLLMVRSAHGRGDKMKLKSSVQHSSCFVAGMVGIGAKTFQRDEDIHIATSLANGCVWAWSQMPFGLMPEIMSVIPCPSSKNCTWDEQAWHQAVLIKNRSLAGISAYDVINWQNLPPGFTRIKDGSYLLRPEAIESIFIMYRITGDTEWQTEAWKMFKAIQSATRTDIAYAAIKNVVQAPLEQMDEMGSCWTGETLKYFYLAFSGPSLISLDEFVFNTKGHPLRRPKRPKGWWS